MTDETTTKKAIKSTLKSKDGTILYPYNPDHANIDLSNLSTTGQAVIDGKTNTDLSNITSDGETVIEDTIANQNKYVTLDTAQTITGAKTFTKTVCTTSNGNCYNVTGVESGEYADYQVVGSDDNRVGTIRMQRSDGYNAMHFSVYAPEDNTNHPLVSLNATSDGVRTVNISSYTDTLKIQTNDIDLASTSTTKINSSGALYINSAGILHLQTDNANTIYMTRYIDSDNCSQVSVDNYDSLNRVLLQQKISGTWYEMGLVGGVTKAPTPSSGDNSTKIATTAFVTTAINNVKRITSTYVSGTSFYRVYSDGWKEQGGSIGTMPTTITFLKAFSNTNYNVQVTMTEPLNGGNYQNLAASSKTTTTFYCSFSGGAYTAGAMWYACGY